MFSRFYAAKKETANANKPVSAAAYIVRDSRTKNEIARGTYHECTLFMNSFGDCYLEPAAA